ncbi:flagellar motor protein MotB [Oceanobacillus sp. FSL H7-0719]|uniref:flagellar motor protein MotB n=1 Tax=Oceanobacillus sp. FSL H7-0719 TaxID=2954507 RepID=UPI00324E44E8
MPKRRRKNEERPDESWLLPYSDMLTLLVALFIVLFAMGEIDAQKYKELANVFRSELSGSSDSIVEEPFTKTTEEVPNENEEEEEEIEDSEAANSIRELNDLKELQANINNYIETNNLTDDLATSLTNEGLFITIVSDISFASGSAEVNEEGITIAKEVSSFLDTHSPHQIIISGHADDRPMHTVEFASNWELSVIRAVNFMKEILADGMHDPTLFSAKGFGEYQPSVPNTSEENRAKNRRVEILVLPNFEINIDED